MNIGQVPGDAGFRKCLRKSDRVRVKDGGELDGLEGTVISTPDTLSVCVRLDIGRVVVMTSDDLEMQVRKRTRQGKSTRGVVRVEIKAGVCTVAAVPKGIKVIVIDYSTEAPSIREVNHRLEEHEIQRGTERAG